MRITSWLMMAASWFQSAWRASSDRRQVLAEYAQLGRMRLLLADIALRGGVFRPIPAAADLYQAGIAEGRRQLALELIRTAGTEPALLQKICFQPVKAED